jgi:HAE1 family hydrophobic/amphiphilic exporter-1/multidrug efflux pump
MQELRPSFPEGVDYAIPFDTTRFVDASIKEVNKTIFEAALLVLAVVFLFLQTWRATLIPMIAVPVSLIGAFAGLWLVGFSINTLTLFALVLAIGIVVDDAIVVLENVERHMSEHKMKPFDAAVTAMREVSSAVVAIVMVLCAVFIPVAFLGGIAGKLYQQFAVTVAVAVVISGMVALTLTPALCALLLKPVHKESWMFHWFNVFFARVTSTYTRAVGLTLRHGIIGTLVFLLVSGAGALMFRAVPGSFVPAEDQGYLIGVVLLPDGATLNRTKVSGDQLIDKIRSEPSVARVFFIRGVDFIGGGNKTNAGTMFVVLQPWDQRDTVTTQLAGKFTGMGMSLPDGLGLVFNPPPIMGLGNAGGFEAYLQSRGDSDPKKLAEVLDSFLGALRQEPTLTGINSFYRASVPQLRVEVDEPKAISLGISLADVYTTLSSTMGALYVNDFNRSGRTYKVQMQADAAYRMTPQDLTKPYVRSAGGKMIPLSSVVTVSTVIGAEQLERYNGFIAAKVMGNGVPGISSGDAIATVERMRPAVLGWIESGAASVEWDTITLRDCG